MNYKEIVNRVDIDLLGVFPRSILHKYRLIPLKKEAGEIVVLSDKRPSLPIIDDLGVYTRSYIKVEIIEGALINRLVNEYLEAPLGTVNETISSISSSQLDDYINLDLDTKVENLEELAHEAPIIRMVNAIITTALKKEASDIHIEPYEDKVEIRYRVDGLLYKESAPPKNLLPAIITRIKIIANLNIAERRLPQDGRIRIKVLGRELDIRVSIIPTIYGESIVLRLLDRADELLELENLDLSRKNLNDYLDLIGHSNGIVLVTGPTGSGKTTTLYATLNKLNS